MPGVIHRDSTSSTNSRVSKDDRRRSSTHHYPQHDSYPSPTSAAAVAPNQGYTPPYPRRAPTDYTAYGLNEPQWTVGPPPIIYNRSPYATVPLPPLSPPPPATPPRIHRLLAYANEPSIIWSINQSTHDAQLARAPSHASYHWRTLPALEPSPSRSPSSLTIRLAPFTRPIVVFPKARDGVITIGDVLTAVYNGARQGAMDEFCAALGTSQSAVWANGNMGAYAQMAMQAETRPRGDDEVSTSVCSALHFRTLWTGLDPSRTERDVWILHTRPLGVR
ncbi:unnamed protein product [Cyclocybe aegerita]|uniref:DUF6699 domain-containing protein n=1 Tax=Cyclocybe aegerita TaxID=1973307 RepID=A0A8S0WQK9_CYCAE|nr:unnamed protein product [Cyclocybe aegerita]